MKKTSSKIQWILTVFHIQERDAQKTHNNMVYFLKFRSQKRKCEPFQHRK